MPSDSAMVKLWAWSVAAVVLLLFLLVNGPRGILDAFSTLSIATGLFIILALFVMAEGKEAVGTGLAVASVLIVGGFLITSTTGFTGIATFMVVFSAVLILVYGFTEKNNPDKNILLLTVAAAVVIFFGGAALPPELSVTATGLMLIITAFGVMTFLFSKFSDKESGLKWAFFVATLFVAGGLLFVFAGFLPAFLFSLAVLFAFSAAKIFPGSTSEGSIISWTGTSAAVLAVFFLSTVQGLFPGLLRGFALVMLAAGLITIKFFLRISEREIPGITSSGLLLGTILTLAGLYLILF
ncbi:MAG: hypothetical protein HY051_01760 [Candidatus Aenigmarchaeota archaeon]|nr:hypothetical protein [Candidatus Aenigmarchaeota archaeon]